MDTHRYRIVIALDRSQYANIVLEHALDQAVRHDAPELHFLTVVESRRADLEPIKRWLAELVLEGLDTFRGGRPDWRTRLHVRSGGAEEEIVNLAAEVDADLLVIGRYGIHHPRRSVADDVIERATCPTLVVGLAGHAAGPPQCPACVEIREQTDGERWFCDAHRSADRHRLTTLLPWSSQLTHGGPLW